jgi:protein TonB
MLFMEIGLVIALVLVVAAFAWSQPERKVEVMTEVIAPIEEEVIVSTEQEQRAPEVRPQVNQVLSEFIDVVRNETQIETNYSFEEFTEDFVIEVPVAAVVEEEAIEDIPIYSAEEMPTFQGGDLMVFRNWVQSQLQYPRIASENNIQGRVLLQFVIERDGTLTNIVEMQSPDRSLSEEAIRVLKTSPKWEPGKQRNRPVRVAYILPVEFVLQQG